MLRTYCRKSLYLKKNFYSRKKYSSEKKLNLEDPIKVRNIGILAHIDAGKTTTTERMLFYSGLIKQMGEVHHGNTVTDYMVQERERGITITSAAVSFTWKKYQFNLIDTPGHIDFTMEVEQTLNVLDGAIIILDASAGVEAQTLTVWRQADKYNIPRIVFVNKMDRFDANLNMCCESIEKKLEKPTICLHVPVMKNDKFVGFVDLVTLKKLVWNVSGLNNYLETDLEEKSEPLLWETSLNLRQKLIDKLSDSDDSLADIIIACESLDNIKAEDILKSLRKSTLDQKIVPVLCGSSYKNIGVQTLMNGIISFLPSPNDINEYFNLFENNLCAKTFKVMHNKQKGPLVFSRIYSGSLKKGEKIYNVQKEQNEQIQRLYMAYADDFEEVETIRNGNIAVIGGLKWTAAGDFLTQSASFAQKMKKKTMKSSKNESEMQNEKSVFSINNKPPEPVFFCSIEPPSLAFQAQLEQALTELQREDPSLRVTYNSETGQTILAGMGELHLEIIKDRIKREYKVDADLGPIQIAYREAPIKKVSSEYNLENKIGNSKHKVSIVLSLIPTEDKEVKDVLKLDKSSGAASNLANIFPKHLLAVKRGIEAGLIHGPKIAAQVVDVQVMLHNIEIGRGTSDTIITAATTQCIQKLLKESGTSVLEPVMNLEIVVPDEHLSVVMADLNRRRTAINNVLLRGNNKVIDCETPLADLVGYSTILRTITSGTATFTMEFSHYQKMSSLEEEKAIQSVHGF